MADNPTNNRQESANELAALILFNSIRLSNINNNMANNGYLYFLYIIMYQYESINVYIINYPFNKI